MESTVFILLFCNVTLQHYKRKPILNVIGEFCSQIIQPNLLLMPRKLLCEAGGISDIYNTKYTVFLAC